MSLPETMKALVNVREGEYLVCGVRDVPTPTVSDPNDVIIKMEASPINPSDLQSLGMVGSKAKRTKLEVAGPGAVKIALSEAAQGKLEDGVPHILGSEGCGIVVAAGDSDEAQALMGKRVAVSQFIGYMQYQKYTIGAGSGFFSVVPEDYTALDCASAFTNPMTAVGFLHTMREEGHKAIVHTAAGSQLGRMLVRHCKELGVPLVNIVRKEEVAAALRELGAEYVINSEAETYKADLLAAVKATGATLGFDAVGGGELGCDMLEAFEQAMRETPGVVLTGFYGPPGYRQVYRYGSLNLADTKMPVSLGVGNWGYGGWLMPFHFKKYSVDHTKTAIKTAVAGLKSTFATSFGKHLTLEEVAGSPEQYLAHLVSQTDQKFLITPNGPV